MGEQRQSRDESSILDNAIANVTDAAVRATLEREVDRLRGSRRFGLVFDRHLPESVRLGNHPIRKGVTVGLRDESTTDLWRVTGFTDTTRAVALLSDGTERPVGDLIVVREFGEPVYPGLAPVETIPNGDPADAWHTVINGENYHVLQALRATHRGKVDLIYIDPPYNTGNDSWIYNDRYIDANDRSRSSKWLSFMERRLLIARDLLKPTGVIIVAIGDAEQHRLRMLLDQVFRPENFISNVVWNGSRKNDATFISNAADYMLFYARSGEALNTAGAKWSEPKTWADEVLSAGQDAWERSGHNTEEATRLLKAWFSKQPRGKFSASHKHYSLVDDQGRVFSEADPGFPNGKGPRYDVIHPVTGLPCRVPENGWRFNEDVFKQMIADGRVHFRADHTALPRPKTFLHEQLNEKAESVFYSSRKAPVQYVARILGDKRFPYPKDHEVLMRWIRLAAPEDAIILDFFGGSGTTSEAVLRLNAEDGGTRQSILVTNNEVGSKQAKVLRKAGHHPGDPEWEAHGVFQYVTRPRLSTVVTGKRQDGSVYSEGLDANVEFFDLTYLDPGMVRRGREFETIAPLLWMEAGATDERINAVPDAGWALTPRYGVLFAIDALKPFAAAVTRAATDETPPSVLFVITDSPTEYQHVVERLPIGITTVRLYEDYLTNYTINTDGGPR